MRAKINQEIFKKIEFLFRKAKKSPEFAKKYITMARQIAKRNNIKLPEELRRNFCHKCNSYYNARNTKTRIKNKKKSIKCLVCGKFTRYILKGGKNKKKK